MFNQLPSRTLVMALVCFLALLSILVSSEALTSSRYPSPALMMETVLPAQPVSSTGSAYFMFDYPPNPETFIFELADPTKIDEARNILAGQEPSHHIMGTIVKQSSWYNPPWHYHLDPASVSFFDNAIEMCDATIQYVEANLDSVCGSFLPGCGWCPWNSRLLAEVHPQTTPTPTATLAPTKTPTSTPEIDYYFMYLPFLRR